MIYNPEDTIAAIASPPGGAARGIIRLSGPRAIEIIAGAREASDAEPFAAPRRPAVLTANLRSDGLEATIPCQLYVWPTMRSYTRQPSIEIHTLGSAPVLQSLLRTLCRLGARLAAPGEFTLRAFLAGRLDLVEAEAVLGVIDARDRRALDAALAQMAGGLGQSLNRLRDELLDLLAHLEAGLDFVEDDIEFIARDELLRQLSAAALSVEELIERTTTRSVAHDAVRAVLVGRPNVGKSSLFNALLAHNAAIVSPAAGTTRDYLVARLTLDEVEIDLVDTAGTAEHSVPAGVEDAAQQAALAERQRADVEVLCLDASRPPDAFERAAIDRPPDRVRVIALLKADRPEAGVSAPGAVRTSSLTGAGVAALRDQLRAAAIESRGPADDVIATTTARCHDSLRSAARALRQARELVNDRGGEELIAIEIRTALDELGQIVGAVYTDDVLDRIFSRFCIGK